MTNFRLQSIPRQWKVQKRGKTNPSSTHSKEIQSRFPAGTFDIILLVDKMEVAGGSAGGKKSRRNITLEELHMLEVPYELKKLSIGDFAWVARSRINGNELVLPYVVERKRMDDLRSSIIDGRYGEQKQRIKNSRIPNKIYLVEEIGYKWNVSSRPADQLHHKGLDRDALDQAMSNTYIRDGFNVIITKSQKDSMRFLSRMTNTMKKIYHQRSLNCVTDRKTLDGQHLVSFQDFYEFSRPNKPLTSRQTFCNMLICQSGLSPGMAWAITEKYPTIRTLSTAFEECDSEMEREALLTGLPYENNAKKVPSSVSKIVYFLFNDEELN